jgi:hypothetical protein
MDEAIRANFVPSNPTPVSEELFQNYLLQTRELLDARRTARQWAAESRAL